MEKTKFFESRQWTIGRNVVFVLVVLLLAGCASHPCREPRAPELDRTKAAQPVPGETPAASGTNLVIEKTVKPSDAKEPIDVAVSSVRVYKPDGSRQCEKKTGTSLEVMERELAGIVVQSRVKRKDGLMHVQVCGSPSGMINVFEISASFLKQAEQRGFKRLED